MRVLGLVALTLVGCVGDAVIVRSPSSDAGRDAPPSDRMDSADPSLRIEVTATGEDNASGRSSFGVSVEIFATRDGAPVDATLTLTRIGGPIPLRTIAPGRYGAGFDEYSSSLVLSLVTLDGVSHDVPLSTMPIFSFLSPRLHEHISSGSPIAVTWAPHDGADVTLLAPSGPSRVDDNGRLTLPPGVFMSTGVHVIRLQRSTSVTPEGLPPGSTLTMTIINSVEVEIE